MSTSKYVVGHGGLKVVNPKSTDESDRTIMLTSGDVVELDDAWVKKVDPRGIQFVTVERFEKLHAAKVASDALKAKHDEEQAKLSAAQKEELAKIERVQDKHLVAIAAAQKAKKLVKPEAKPPVK